MTAGDDGDGPDFDKEWRSLVARLEADDLPDDPFGTAEDGRPPGDADPLWDAGAPTDDGTGSDDRPDDELDRLWMPESADADRLWLPNVPAEPEELDEDDEGTYDPPEPPPLGWLESPPALVLCWIGAVCAPLYALFVVLFWHSAPGYTILIAVGAFIAGMAGLIMSMPDHRDDDDDGAVV